MNTKPILVSALVSAVAAFGFVGIAPTSAIAAGSAVSAESVRSGPAACNPRLWHGFWIYEVAGGDHGSMRLTQAENGKTVSGSYKGRAASGTITGKLSPQCLGPWRGSFRDKTGLKNRGSFYAVMLASGKDLRGVFKVKNGGKYTWSAWRF